jgi:ABC-type dipeptide/oligopeptide/nickel transport system permease subunit
VNAGTASETVALPAAAGEHEWPLVRRLARRRTALLGFLVVALVILVAILAPVLSPFDPLEQDIGQRLKPPGWQDAQGRVHPLGTDHLGRDIAARIIFGSRVALVVGLAAVLISGMLGLLIGLVAGYFGGRVDDLLMRLADIQLAFPFILLAIAVIGVLGPSLRNIIIVIGVRCSRSVSASTCKRPLPSAAATGESCSTTCCRTPSRRGWWWPLWTWPASS